MSGAEKFVKCDNCHKEFPEEEVIFDDEHDTEYCPYCKESDCIVDV